MNNTSLPPTAQEIATQHQAEIVALAEQFCRQEYNDASLHVRLIPESSAVIEGDTRRGAFLLMHNYGFVGVEAPIKEDGSLGGMICRKV